MDDPESCPSPSEPAQPTLFPLPPAAGPRSRTRWPRADQGARMLRAQRTQVSWGLTDLDAQIGEDHPARAIWAVVERLDLSPLYAQIRARDQVAGTSAIDPAILVALWVYATSEGVGSAREIERLIDMHAAYKWICGGVSVRCHTLSDFRSEQGAIFDDLVTQVLALLGQQGLVELSRIAQDGTRIRASAGAGSFRREATLQQLLQQAREHLDAVTREAADPEISARRAAARRRGARQRMERLEAALNQIPDVIATKKRSGAKDATPRVSTTDPEARVMKMGDGGFRPAYNVQFATTADEARVIVGIGVTNRGSDAGQAVPMVEQIEGRMGAAPSELLVDGGYAQLDAIETLAGRGVTVYAPVPTPRGETKDRRDPYVPLKGDSEAVSNWRTRMGTEIAKQIYKQRAATAETVNADAKVHRGLDHLVLRGADKVLGTVGLFALTYNILRLITLGG